MYGYNRVVLMQKNEGAEYSDDFKKVANRMGLYRINYRRNSVDAVILNKYIEIFVKKYYCVESRTLSTNCRFLSIFNLKLKFWVRGITIFSKNRFFLQIKNFDIWKAWLTMDVVFSKLRMLNWIVRSRKSSV